MATTTVITQEQLDRCTRILHENTGEVFYKVQSESDELKEYEVHFIKGRGFTCSCPAGQSGFRNCRSTCKHCRWAARHAECLREERKEQARITRLVNQGVSREVAQCITYANAHPFQYSALEVKRAEHNNQRKPFSILR